MRSPVNTIFGCAIIGIVMLVSLTGCSSVSYYSQSVVGHSKLMLARQPVAQVIETASPRLKEQLELSVQLKGFAEQVLDLPNNGSYTQYVALEREFPVWNVVAVPEFSVQAKQWCYPVVGCASYRGYFKHRAAEKFAKKMRDKGYETTVGGATAYSTLGWFSDPILPSMLRYGDTDFAETLFHELAHQRLYVNGDSNFNEAFATVVGEEGAKLWLTQTRPKALAEYLRRRQAVRDFNALVAGLKDRLSRGYQSAVSPTEMRAAKQRVFEQFSKEYQRLKHDRWLGKGWFDRWFDTPLSNARIAAFSPYYELVPELTLLLEKCGSEFDQFYRVLSDAEKIDGTVVLPSSCDN